MIGAVDTYYLKKEVSNSDLSELDKYFKPSEWLMDATQAYRFGNLVDAMITEPGRCDHLSRMVDDEPFTQQEWDIAYAMLNVFRGDESCAQYLKMSDTQKVFVRDRFEINHEGFEFSLPVRCKFDLWFNAINWGGDIKSTTATTQKQFEEAVRYFEYDRQRAWYMDISGAQRDMLIGISKKNFRIFKVPITRDSELYKSGKLKYQQLAFRWWTLFADF